MVQAEIDQLADKSGSRWQCFTVSFLIARTSQRMRSEETRRFRSGRRVKRLLIDAHLKRHMVATLLLRDPVLPIMRFFRRGELRRSESEPSTPETGKVDL